MNHHYPDVRPLRRIPEHSTAAQELWRYSYPHHKDSVPSWSVPIIALCAPILFLTVYSQIWRASRLEIHNAILGGLSCVIFTALVTNLVKLAVRVCKLHLSGLRRLTHMCRGVKTPPQQWQHLLSYPRSKVLPRHITRTSKALPACRSYMVWCIQSPCMRLLPSGQDLTYF